jgi:hypothetical protein
MKKILFAAAFAIFAHTQAFAIVGAGAHYVMNITGSLKSSSGTAYNNDALSINVDQQKADGLQGIGFKAWIDFLPLVDVEGTLNVAATRYKTSLVIKPTVGDSIKIPLAYTPDAPYNMIFNRADPLYGIVSGDLSVTYPITSLPIIRPYAGLGLSYLASIPIINDDFARKMLNNSGELVNALIGSDPNDVDKAATEIGDALVKTLKNSDYKTNITGHAIVGFRLKLPIIPLAIYTNGKYYFGGDVVLEVGGGLAI